MDFLRWVLELRERERLEKEKGRLVRPVRREELEKQRVLEEWIVESEGWERRVEEEESAMARGFKVEVSIEEAIGEIGRRGRGRVLERWER